MWQQGFLLPVPWQFFDPYLMTSILGWLQAALLDQTMTQAGLAGDACVFVQPIINHGRRLCHTLNTRQGMLVSLFNPSSVEDHVIPKIPHYRQRLWIRWWHRQAWQGMLGKYGMGIFDMALYYRLSTFNMGSCKLAWYRYYEYVLYIFALKLGLQ